MSIPMKQIKNNDKNFFNTIIIIRFNETKVAKEELHCAKKTINTWDVNVNNIVITKLIKIKKNSKNFIWYLDEVIRPLVLILPKMSGYVKTFKFKEEYKNSKLMSFHIGGEKLLEKYETIWIKIDDLMFMKKIISASIFRQLSL